MGVNAGVGSGSTVTQSAFLRMSFYNDSFQQGYTFFKTVRSFSGRDEVLDAPAATEVKTFLVAPEQVRKSSVYSLLVIAFRATALFALLTEADGTIDALASIVATL